MAETVLVRGESGNVLVHDLPLPDGLAQRVATGEATVLGPCDADGNLIPAVEPEPAPVKRAAVKKAAPSVPEE